MKALMLFILLGGGVLNSLTLTAQQIRLRGLPHTTGQYLIIENAEEFSNFKLDVLEIKNDGSTIKRESLRLLRTNFYYLKPEYFDSNNGNFEVTLTAFNSSGVVVDEITAPVIPANPPTISAYQWKCTSPTYAYGLTAAQQIGNDSFWLDNVYDKYVWWDMTVDFPIALEGVGIYWTFQEFMAVPGALNNIPHNDATIKRYGPSGGQIPANSTTFLRGIPKKVLPQWQAFLGEVGNSNSQNNSFICGSMPENPDALFQDYSSYVDCVNLAVTFANTLEPQLDLYCAGMPSGYRPDMDGGSNYNNDNDWDAKLDEIWSILTSSDGFISDNPPSNVSGNPSDLWDVLISLFSQPESNVNDFNAVIDNVGGIRFDNLSTKEATQFSNAQLAAAASNFRSLTFTLNPGVHVATIACNDGSIRSFYFATKSKVNNTVEMKDFIGVNIFPNPIVGNDYMINLTSQISTSIIYEVLDLQGNALYRDRFLVKENSDVTPKIIFPSNIPSGVLVHRFVFPDGSWKSVLTTK